MARHRTGGRVARAIYPDAPHSFFDRGHARFQQECADAWRMTLDFAAAPGNR